MSWGHQVGSPRLSPAMDWSETTWKLHHWSIMPTVSAPIPHSVSHVQSSSLSLRVWQQGHHFSLSCYFSQFDCFFPILGFIHIWSNISLPRIGEGAFCRIFQQTRILPSRGNTAYPPLGHFGCETVASRSCYASSVVRCGATDAANDKETAWKITFISC